MNNTVTTNSGKIFLKSNNTKQFYWSEYNVEVKEKKLLISKFQFD